MGGSGEQRIRQLLAQEAARLMAEEGVRDYQSAKRKAAHHLGVSDSRNLPKNREIEAALEMYQRLFSPPSQADHLDELRHIALQAMEMLTPFSPRLVGPVLKGTAGEHAVVELQLFSEPAEAVAWRLMEHDIPYETSDKRLRFSSEDRGEPYPMYQFIAGDIAIELVVLPEKYLRQSPLSPANGKPMKRASIKEVRALLTQTSNIDAPLG